MIKHLFLLFFIFGLSACDDSIQATKVEGHAKQPFEKNAIDAAGVAEGEDQVSPNGRPAY